MRRDVRRRTAEKVVAEKFPCPSCAKLFELHRLLEHVETSTCKQRANKRMSELLRRADHDMPAEKVLELSLQEILQGAVVQ